MKQYQYANYEEYVAAQTEANKRKLANVWARPDTIEQVAHRAPAKVFGVLCHGTRNGAEQLMFKQQFPCALVVGTEISETAANYQYTVQHDFHEPRAGWGELFDIVYSNSLDHAYDPRKALATWRGQLARGGRMFIEYSFTEACNVSSPSDPLEITEQELRGLFTEAGLKVVDTFGASGVKGADSCASTVFVLERA